MALLLAACGGPPADDSDAGTTDSAPWADTDDLDTGSYTGDSDTSVSDTSDSDTDVPVDDADGDGHLALEAGGDDCDDDDPTTWPGAEEWCDTKDHDCDGEPLAPGVCGKVQSDVAILRPVVKVDFETQLFTSEGASIVTDRTGDGVGDLLIACVMGCLTSGASNGNLLYAGGLPDEVPTLPDGAAHTWRASSEGDYAAYYALDPGDVDGDGIADLAFPLHGPFVGIYVFHGPFELDGATDRIDYAPDVYTAAYRGKAWGHPTVAGVDFDGDGRSDFAARAYGEGTDIFYGGTDRHVRLGWEGWGGEMPEMASLGDIDGDGLSDLYTHFAWISGGDLIGAEGVAPSDLASGTWHFEHEEWRTGDGDFRSVGDWDGDGYVEIVAGNPDAETIGEFSGEVYFFGGDHRGAHTISDPSGSLVGDELDGVGAHVRVADLDLDGVSDVVTLAVYAQSWHVVPASGGVPPLRTSIHDRSLEFSGMWMSNNPGGDLTGDGGDDWLAATEEGNLGVYPGWHIPWDEPVWW